MLKINTILNGICRSNNFSCTVPRVAACFNQTSFRLLYSEKSLGLDDFKNARERLMNQYGKLREGLVERLEKTSNDGSKMIFTEDLKNFLIIAENNDREMKIIVDLIDRFCQQTDLLRLTKLTFGPVLMRLLTCYGKAEFAYDFIKNEKYGKLFTNITSHLLCMDLLFKNELYDQVLDVYQIFCSRKVASQRFPRDLMNLVYASLYKMNTPDSFSKAHELFLRSQEDGVLPTIRSISFISALALYQNNPAFGLEVLSNSRYPYHPSIRNLRIIANLKLERFGEAVHLIIQSLEYGNSDRPPFFKDTVAFIEESITKIEDEEMKDQLDKLVETMKQNGKVNENSLDSYLLYEIEREETTKNFKSKRDGGSFHNQKDRSQNFRQFNEERRFDNRRQTYGDTRQSGYNEQRDNYANKSYGKNRENHRDDNFNRMDWRNRRNFSSNSSNFNKNGFGLQKDSISRKF